MHDLLLALLWLVVLAVGAGVCALLFRAGMPRTYVRDLLHVGAGSWVLGWPFWNDWRVPTLIPVLATLGLIALARGPRRGPLAKFQEAISDQDERWSGIVLYALAVAFLTPIGLRWEPLAAGAGLLALALGDGIGGLVGRRFGRRKFQLPGSKPKSLEGAAAVALLSFAGVLIAEALFGVSLPLWVPAVAALTAALAEAVAPRATDNLLVPGAVFAVLLGVMRLPIEQQWNFRVTVGHGQLGLHAEGPDSGFNLWREVDVAQGFTCRPGSIGWATVLDGGNTEVEVHLYDQATREFPPLDPRATRAILLPFIVSDSGKLEVATTYGASKTFRGRPGLYAARFENGATGQETMWARLTLLPAVDQVVPKILLADPGLHPPEQLHLDAEPAL